MKINAFLVKKLIGVIFNHPGTIITMGSFGYLLVLVAAAAAMVAVMGIADLYLLSVLAFIAILALMVYRDRRNFRRESILLLRRTKAGRGFIRRAGERFPGFWRALGTIGVFAGFGASIYMVYFLIERLVNTIMVPSSVPPLGFVLPTPAATGTIAPGVFLVPFWHWIISIGVLVLVHEGLHGIMAAMERTRIKSLGWGILAVIPLAFVEPDEKQLERKGPWAQLRVFAAGSWANFMTAGAALAVFTLFVSGIYIPLGVGFTVVHEGYPAYQANLTGVITRINQEDIRTYEDLNTTLAGTGTGSSITVYTAVLKEDGSYEEKAFYLATVGRPDNLPGSYIGIAGLGNVQRIRDELVPYTGPIQFAGGLLAFLFMINLGVGLFNLLPIKPLDGGRMWEILIRRLAPKRGDMIVRRLGHFTLLLLLLIFATIGLSYI